MIKVPTELQDAFRIAVCVFAFITPGVLLRGSYSQSWYMQDIMQLTSWGAITTTVVSTPLIGSTTQKGESSTTQPPCTACHIRLQCIGQACSE